MAKENTGKLIRTTGKVKNIVKDDKGVVGQITVDDGTGPAIVYINGYITKDVPLDFVKVGSKITVTGLASVGENYQSETDFVSRIRIRDRGEIVLVEGPSDNGGSSDDDSSTVTQGSDTTSVQTQINKLTANEKEAIKEKAKENMPYTSLTNTLTVEQLNVLTNGKFTMTQLQELLKKPELLAQLGIDVQKNMTTVGLIKDENKIYADLTEKHWAYESVQRLTALGIVQGSTEGNFNPKANLQISDAFTLLDRVLLLNGVTEMKLSRSVVEKYVTDKEHWAFAHVASVASKLNEKTLKSVMALQDEPLSREIFAQIIFEITDGKLEKVNPAKMFKDTQDSLYKEALDYCVEVGVFYGMNENEMNPQEKLTRAQIMTVLERLNEQLGK